MLQAMDEENVIKKPSAVPAYAAMVKGMPELMSFYERLRERVFPDGPSEKWVPGMFDPRKGVVPSTSGSASTAAAGAT